MIKRLIAIMLVAVMAVAVLAASPVAEKSPRTTEPVVVTDMIGRNVEIVPGSYTRVVCIGAGALRMYTYINGADLLCGVEDIDNTSLQNRPKMFDSVAIPYRIAYETEFSKLQSCGVGGPQAQAAEAEKILSCNPDIVISEYEDVQKEDALQEQLGVPVITLRSGPNNVFDDSFIGSLRLLGLIFGKEARAEDIASFIASEKAAISSRTAVVPEDSKPSVYICGLGNWGTTNHLMTMPNYIAFDVANVKNAASGLSVKGVQAIEKEYFVSLGKDMDIIVMDAAAVKNIKPLYKEDPTMFDTCKAWKDGEVYLQMAFNAYYTNYEIALANTWFIAKTVYPDLFKDIDLSAKMDEITEVFLGQPLAEKIFSYPTSFGGYQKIDTKTFFN
ncbi:MAG: ABC transporter substrate-binding protein [Candidatus Methanomethylophilaceae archaeon]|nr:ABC transporter substrate-binding protein [Candidatus Methanomethylophilaceae archaeon]